METKTRPAVRIVCLDAAGRVLLLHWRDPFDGSTLWEPPGGGIDPGETPLQTARRELGEETGLDPAAILADRFVDVQRNVRWNGARNVSVEQFFLARFDAERPALAPGGLLPDEEPHLTGHRWFAREELPAAPDRLEPPELAAVAAALTAADGPGPWTT